MTAITHPSLDQLNAWLDKYSARVLWQQKLRNVGTLTCHQIGEGIAMVMVYSRAMGWDLFVPASLDPAIDATLKAAGKALKVQS